MGSTTDKVKGNANEAIGKAKQGIGEATGSDRMKGEGAVQEVKGKGQQAHGRCQGRREGGDGSRRGSGTPRSGIARHTERQKTGRQAGLFICPFARRHFTASNSTSNISVAFGGITPPAPRAP